MTKRWFVFRDPVRQEGWQPTDWRGWALYALYAFALTGIFVRIGQSTPTLFETVVAFRPWFFGLTITLICIRWFILVRFRHAADAYNTWFQKQSASITPKLLSQLDDDELPGLIWQHVFDLVHGRTNSGKETQLTTLSKGKRYVWATMSVENEIMNGGFVQLFCNSTKDLVPTAIEGYQAFGIAALASVLKDALSIFQRIRPTSRRSASSFDQWDWFGAHPKIAQELEVCDKNFDYRAQHDRARQQYIRTHPEQFVDALSAGRK